MKRSASFHECSIETLESRIAPATVSGVLANGILKITALSLSSAVGVQLQQLDADSFRLMDGSDPTVDYNGVRGIQVVLSDVNDDFTLTLVAALPEHFFRGSVKIDARAGSDNLMIGGFNGVLVGDLAVKAAGAPALFVNSNTTIRGAVQFTSVGGDFLFDGTAGSVSLVGTDFLIAQQTSVVRGAFKIVNSTANGTFNLNGSITGALAVTGGDMIETVNLRGPVDGAVKLALGEAPGFVNVSENFTAGSSFTVVGGTQFEQVNIDLSSQLFAVAFAGPVNLKLGDGNNRVSVHNTPAFGAAVTVTSGIGDDTVEFPDNATIQGALKTTLGAGTNSLQLGHARVLGLLTFTGGANNDTFTSLNADFFGGMKLALGDGTNTADVAIGLIHNGLTVNTGSGDDTLRFNVMQIRGSMKVGAGDGINELRVGANSDVRCPVSYKGGSGEDRVFIDSNTTITGTLKITPGDGPNLGAIGNLGNLSTFTYTGGIGSDFVDIDNAGGEFVRGKVLLGDGSDTVFFDNDRFISFTIDGGLGGDNITRSGLSVTNGLIVLNFEAVA